MKNMKKNHAGFTLIELMIVVAIIGILAAIALPAYRDYTIRSNISQAVGSLGGEKVKLVENWNNAASGANICNGPETSVAQCTNLGGASWAELTASSADGTVTVTMNPSFPTGAGGRVVWTCNVDDAPDTSFENTSCLKD